MSSTPPLNFSVPGLVAFATVVLILSLCSIVLRFWSRLVSPGGLGLDDWLALSAVPCTASLIALIYVGARNGLGQHISDLSVDQISFLLGGSFGIDILFNLSISLSKISALVFYGKIFKVRSSLSKAWSWTFFAVLTLAIVWPIAWTIYAIFTCQPVERYWLFYIPGTCAGQFPGTFGSAISSVIIDLAILIIPLPPIWKLNLKTSRKLSLAAVFVLGYSVVCMSIGRLVTAAELGDFADTTYVWVQVLYWLVAECGLSTLVICLPAMYHLYRRFHRFGFESLFTHKEYTQSRSRQTGDSAKSNRYRWIKGGRKSTEHSSSSYTTVDAEAGLGTFRGALDQNAAALLPLQPIHVQNHVNDNTQSSMMDDLPSQGEPTARLPSGGHL